MSAYFAFRERKINFFAGRVGCICREIISWLSRVAKHFGEIRHLCTLLLYHLLLPSAISSLKRTQFAAALNVAVTALIVIQINGIPEIA